MARLTAQALIAAGFAFGAPSALGSPQGPARDYSIREIVRELSSVVGQIQDRRSTPNRIDMLGDESGGSTRYVSLPSAWPVRTGYISSRFGFRLHPNRGTRTMHTGIDFAGAHGTPIFAVADGIVTFSGRHGDYGRTIDLRHPNGLVTRYAHNQENLVREGDQIRQGQRIATIGTSGNATGPHLHFEVIRDGRPIDPMRVLETMPRTLLAKR